MSWAAPLAWLLAIGIVGPLAAHLLSRRPPTAHPFPTIRFLRTTATSARRLRTLHDPWLWLLRTSIVLVLAGAAAGPTLDLASRRAGWEAPIQEAIVTASSIGMTSGAPAQASDSAAVADAEDAWRYDAVSLREGVGRALQDLASVRDRRRQITIRWSGDARAFAPEDMAAIPSEVGVRLEVTSPAEREVGREPTLAIDAAAEDTDAARLVLDAAGDGDPVGAADVSWPGGAERASLLARATAPGPRAAEVFRRMQIDPRLADAARRSRPDARADTNDRSATRLAPLARDARGHVLVWGAQTNDERLLLVVDARPTDPLALWSVRSLAEAVRAVDGWPRPSRPWTTDELRAHARPPADLVVARLPGGLDTRWWWLAAGVLLAIEQVWRRRPHVNRVGDRDGDVVDRTAA